MKSGHFKFFSKYYDIPISYSIFGYIFPSDHYIPNNLPVMQSFSPSVSLVWASPLCTVHFKLVPVFNLDMFGNLTHTHILFFLLAFSLSSVGNIYPSPKSYHCVLFPLPISMTFHSSNIFLSFQIASAISVFRCTVGDSFPLSHAVLILRYTVVQNSCWVMRVQFENVRLYDVFICLSLLTHEISRWEFETLLSFKT